jgi:hypothetical protein
VNRTRSVALPWLPAPGRTFALDVSATPSRATLLCVGIPLLAPERARLEVPSFGVLGLRADAIIQLDPLYVPPGTGTSRATVRVPRDPGLIGAAVHAQVVLVHPLHTRLTKVATTVIVD